MFEVKFDDKEIEMLVDGIADRVSLEFVDLLKKNIREMNLIAWGKMIKSIEVENLGVGKRIVVVDVPYASYVEFGTKPHKVPKRVLFEWAKVKFKLDDKSAWALANYVRKKIEEKGTKPHPFFRRSYYELLEKLEKEGIDYVNVRW